jgi:glycosyltransferase involved in cell wall biosynthesis
MNSTLDVSVVVIGRNEGERLTRCLQSVHAGDWDSLSWELIYVDSHSVDDSKQRAGRQGAQVLSLGDMPPCAAAGRNIGWRAARGELVLFLDGDTLLEPGFVRHALAVLRAQAPVVAVWGHRRELNPAQSIYTRVLDLDWVFAPGRVEYFGGDVLVRRQALEAAGGFDDRLVAGEEPELCRRLRAQGGHIEHVDVPMTRHDLAITSLSAWWRRAERAGLAYAQVSSRFAGTDDPLWRREAIRNRWHGSLLLVLPLVAVAAGIWHPAAFAALALVLLAAWFRSARRCRWKCPRQPGLAWAYAAHSHLQQVPILAGQWRWWRLRRARRQPTLIEYHAPGRGAES